MQIHTNKMCIIRTHNSSHIVIGPGMGTRILDFWVLPETQLWNGLKASTISTLIKHQIWQKIWKPLQILRIKKPEFHPSLYHRLINCTNEKHSKIVVANLRDLFCTVLCFLIVCEVLIVRIVRIFVFTLFWQM